MPFWLTIQQSWKFLLVLAILGGLFGAHPYAVARMTAGSHWQGVVPEFKSDSLSYVTHANAVIHGGVWGENPYYAGTYKAPAPAFSLNNFVSGFPYAFLSPFAATVWNAFLWNAIFAFLLGALLLWLGYSWLFIIPLWLVVHASDFGFMLRTSSMQLVYPYFFIFVILFLSAWSRGNDKMIGERAALYLGLCAGLAAYWQPFLFQVIMASLFSGIFLAFVFCRKKLFRSLLIGGVLALLSSVPYFAYFHGISGIPGFGEIMNYMGGIRSHVPPPQLYFYGRWLAALLGWAFLLWFLQTRITPQNKENLPGDKPAPVTEDVIFVTVAVSLGILGAMMQNIVTGVEIGAAAHVYRFIVIMLALGAALFVRPTIQALSLRGLYLPKLLLLVCVVTVVARIFVVLPSTFPRAIFYSLEISTPPMVAPVGNPQYVMPALRAISSLPGEQVIAAPYPLDHYIPLYTGKHLLVSPWGDLYTGSIESIERNFVSFLGRSLTWDDFLQNRYGSSTILARVEERNRVARKLCLALLHSPSCATTVFARPFTFDAIIDQSVWFRYYQTIARHPLLYLKRFGVTQVVVGRRFAVPEFLHGQMPWYSDDYYAIYDIRTLPE